MVNTGNALHLAIKLHAGGVRTGGGFQVFCGAKLCKHLAFDAPLLAAGCHLRQLHNRCHARQDYAAADTLYCCVRRSCCASCASYGCVQQARICQQRRQPVVHPHLQLITFHRPHFFGVRPGSGTASTLDTLPSVLTSAASPSVAGSG